MRGFVLMALLLGSVAMPALADDSSYIDDRSTGSKVIESFYNAINRSEYARAYSYFGDEAAQSFEDFRAGYADTVSVTVRTGEESSDGAAGSTFFSVPVALDAADSAGKHTIFAGCYQLRLVQPALQEQPPFRPLHIEKGDLKPAEGDLEKLAMTPCPES